MYLPSLPVAVSLQLPYFPRWPEAQLQWPLSLLSLPSLPHQPRWLTGPLTHGGRGHGAMNSARSNEMMLPWVRRHQAGYWLRDGASGWGEARLQGQRFGCWETWMLRVFDFIWRKEFGKESQGRTCSAINYLFFPILVSNLGDSSFFIIIFFFH